MGKEVVLTPVAEENYEAILDYLPQELGAIATANFVDRFSEVCLLFSETPEIHPFADKLKDVRKCVVSKHNTMYFKEYTDFIRIIAIFDNRQHPNRLNKLL